MQIYLIIKYRRTGNSVLYLAEIFKIIICPFSAQYVATYSNNRLPLFGHAGQKWREKLSCFDANSAILAERQFRELGTNLTIVAEACFRRDRTAIGLVRGSIDCVHWT